MEQYLTVEGTAFPGLPIYSIVDLPAAEEETSLTWQRMQGWHVPRHHPRAIETSLGVLEPNSVFGGFTSGQARRAIEASKAILG